MFEIEFKPAAIQQLKGLKRHYAAMVVRAIEKHLKHNPESPMPPRIKKLRGRQQAAYRLRVGDYRVFYDVADAKVTVVAILPKSETEGFYLKEER